MKSTFRIAIYFCDFVPFDFCVRLSFIQNCRTDSDFLQIFKIVTTANFVVADPGFPRQGGNPKGGCTNLLFWPCSPENCMELK